MKKYRVGVQGAFPLWLTEQAINQADIRDVNSYTRLPIEAATFAPKVAMTWVQILSSHFHTVVVEQQSEKAAAREELGYE